MALFRRVSSWWVRSRQAEVDLTAFVGPHQVEAFTLDRARPADTREPTADRRYRAGQFGAAGGVASGRGLSRMYRRLLETFTAQTIADSR